jgi:3-deoxy-7-phosphoheptulonate synthase
VLRGATNKHGNSIPNYHYEDLRLLFNMYEKRNLKNPAAIIDTNHSNSGKRYLQQIRIAKEVMDNRNYDPELKTLVKGLMIESYIEDGSQPIGAENHVYGKSITDPCLGWEKSEALIYDIYKMC